MTQSEFCQRVIKEILLVGDNLICIDCGTSPTSHVILDYSAFICESCFLLHLSLEFRESLHPISFPFTSDSLKKLIHGGNTAIYEYFQLYDLNYKAISYKYSTLAAVYYKELITSVCNSNPFNMPLLPSDKARRMSEVAINAMADGYKEISFRESCCSENRLSFIDKLENEFKRIKESVSEFFSKGKKGAVHAE